MLKTPDSLEEKRLEAVLGSDLGDRLTRVLQTLRFGVYAPSDQLAE